MVSSYPRNLGVLEKHLEQFNTRDLPRSKHAFGRAPNREPESENITKYAVGIFLGPLKRYEKGVKSQLTILIQGNLKIVVKERQILDV